MPTIRGTTPRLRYHDPSGPLLSGLPHRDEPPEATAPGLETLLQRGGINPRHIDEVREAAVYEHAADLAVVWRVHPGTASRRMARRLGEARAVLVAEEMLCQLEETGRAAVDPATGLSAEDARFPDPVMVCFCRRELAALGTVVAALLRRQPRPAVLYALAVGDGCLVWPSNPEDDAPSPAVMPAPADGPPPAIGLTLAA